MIVFLIALIIVTLCAIAVIYSNINILLRSVLVVAIILSSLYCFVVIQSYKGSPIHIKGLPAEVVVYGQAVDFETSDIYILYTLVDLKMPPIYVSLDYDFELHEALANGLEGFGGEPFVLKNHGEKDGRGGEDSGNPGENADGEGDQNLSLESSPYMVYELPPAILPKKN